MDGFQSVNNDDINLELFNFKRFTSIVEKLGKGKNINRVEGGRYKRGIFNAIIKWNIEITILEASH